MAMHSNFNDLKTKTMTAKEFIEKEGLEYELAEYDEGGFLGIDERLLEQKIEEYHQAKLKLLGIADVAGRSEQLHKLLQYLSDEDELVGNRTHQEIIDSFNQLG